MFKRSIFRNFRCIQTVKNPSGYEPLTVLASDASVKYNISENITTYQKEVSVSYPEHTKVWVIVRFSPVSTLGMLHQSNLFQKISFYNDEISYFD